MSDPFIGSINMFGFPFPPRDWTTCSGQLLTISQFTTVFSLLGTYFGGDGRTNFGIPDLRGRSPVNIGQHPGSYYDYRMGQTAGTETTILQVPNLPAHNHAASFASTSTLTASKDTVNKPNADNGYYLASQPTLGGSNMYIDTPPSGSQAAELGGLAVDGTISVSSTGSNQAFNNVGPIIALNFCLALQGIYPSRN